MSATRQLASALALSLFVSLCGCATAYGPDNPTGGFSDTSQSADLWRVRYGGNGYTTQETVQTYWLYHCAELTLAKGYDGFELVTRVNLSALNPRGGADADATGFIKIHGGGGGGGAHVTTFVYGGGVVVDKPTIVGEIKLLKRPFTAVPGRIFDAITLKAFLAPYVTGPKCGGNVCPHVHAYLYPPTS